jgi:hypothetical protein
MNISQTRAGIAWTAVLATTTGITALALAGPASADANLTVACSGAECSGVTRTSDIHIDNGGNTRVNLNILPGTCDRAVVETSFDNGDFSSHRVSLQEPVSEFPVKLTAGWHRLGVSLKSVADCHPPPSTDHFGVAVAVKETAPPAQNPPAQAPQGGQQPGQAPPQPAPAPQPPRPPLCVFDPLNLSQRCQP